MKERKNERKKERKNERKKERKKERTFIFPTQLIIYDH
jgi:hypothetical protein